ncbi:hypothetical protein CC78DRAFT_620261 [Lojkania enalia]|uniref:Secreted protein n=1 Tax=Lojkania enalia TaxID=147567 RepID=A0A9P4MWQ2_9PLEO|nr:hypothetical protein CC78DRAFT_620261 [Didymosphaeria enalia]
MLSILFIPLIASLATAFPTPEEQALENIAKAILSRAPIEANPVLKSVTSSGTGCASNSAAFIIEESATLAFDSMVVNRNTVGLQKKCLIVLDLEVDPSWKYTINKASDLRGYVDQADATFSAVYQVGSSSSAAVGNINGANSSQENWSIHSSKDAGATSGCGGGLTTIDVTLRLLPGTFPESIITLDSMDIAFEYSRC